MPADHTMIDGWLMFVCTALASSLAANWRTSFCFRYLVLTE